ncbi:PAS domain-containing protein [Sphingomonas sp. LR60]|uniref:PAS domain-containing protein n=1 Tax=Sphingomonas sp. LR60 TaxID=3050233 RepID=UPI002FE2F9FC
MDGGDEAPTPLLLLGIAKMTWEAAPDCFVEVDSPTWREYTGQRYDDWKGFGWLTALQPDDRQLTALRWRDAVRQGRPVHVEYRLRRYDGLYRRMGVHAVPMHNESGVSARWLGVVVDIDDARGAEQKH